MEILLTPEPDYDVIRDASEVVENRLQEREAFVENSTYQIAKAWIENQVDEDQTHRVIEEVGNKYPLSLEEMAQIIGKVYEAKELGLVKPPEKEDIHCTKAWSELLAKMNPKYTIFKDEDGDISLGLVKK